MRRPAAVAFILGIIVLSVCVLAAYDELLFEVAAAIVGLAVGLAIALAWRHWNGNGRP